MELVADVDRLKRRDFIRAATAAGLAGFDWDRLAALPEHVDGRMVDDLEALLESYLGKTYDAGPAVMLTAIVGQLRTLYELAAVPKPPSIERRIQRLTSRTATLASWTAHRADHQAAAHAYCARALEQGRAAGDGHLEARAMFIRTLLYPGESADQRDGSLGPVLAMLEAAEKAAGREAPIVLRSWIEQRRSEELAADGAIAAAERAMDISDAVGSGPGGDPWGPEWSVIYRARIANLGGQHQRAVDELDALLGSDRPLEFMRFIAQVGRAHAFASLEEPEPAAEALSAALRLAVDRGEPYRVHRVLTCRGRLSRWQQVQAVRQLDVELVAWHRTLGRVQW